MRFAGILCNSRVLRQLVTQLDEPSVRFIQFQCVHFPRGTIGLGDFHVELGQRFADHMLDDPDEQARERGHCCVTARTASHLNGIVKFPLTVFQREFSMLWYPTDSGRPWRAG